MGNELYVGCRVRILFVRNQVFQHLPGTTGTIVGRALPAYPFNKPDEGDWLVSCDLYGSTQCPFYTYVQAGAGPFDFAVAKHYPHFCPKGDQLKPIFDWDPSTELVPVEELEYVE